MRRHLDALRIHLNACHAVLPGMRAAGWGRVVLVSGALGARLHPGFGMYSAAKEGVNALTRTLALEEGAHGITANVVAPGRVLEQGGDPEDVAAAVAYLASPGASAVTGQVIYLAAGEAIR